MKIKKIPLVIIIASNYNGISYFYKKRNILWHVFSSLKKTAYENYKIIMADDKSTDKSVEYVRKHFKNVEIVINNVNGGFSKNNNNAIKYVMHKYDPDYIVLMNNDIIISDTLWLSKLVKVAESDPKIGIIGCKLVYPTGRIQHAGMEIGYYGARNIGRGQKDYLQFDYIKEIEGVTFAAVLIDKKTIEKIGLLDENFFMGFEDIDYCIRAKQLGSKIYYDGLVQLVHLEGYSSTNSKFVKVRLKSFYRSQVNFWYFLLKYWSMKKFNRIDRFKSILVFFLASIFSIEGLNRERGLRSIRLKEKPFRRLLLSFEAIIEARNLYKAYSNNK